MTDLLSKELLAGIAILITLAGYAQYFRNIIKGHTKPHLFSWLIWGTLTAIAFAAQISDNAGPGAWITALTAVISFIIVVYACFVGEKEISRGDWATFISALIAIPVWLITDNPVWSVWIVTIIDALGFYPTYRKSWYKPHEETVFHYFMAGLKFVLALMALENFTLITALYPFSLVVMNGVFVILILMRRRAINEKTN